MFATIINFTHQKCTQNPHRKYPVLDGNCYGLQFMFLGLFRWQWYYNDSKRQLTRNRNLEIKNASRKYPQIHWWWKSRRKSSSG